MNKMGNSQTFQIEGCRKTSARYNCCPFLDALDINIQYCNKYHEDMSFKESCGKPSFCHLKTITIEEEWDYEEALGDVEYCS